MLARFIPNPRLRRLLVGSALAVAAYTAAGFLLVPPLARWILAERLSESFHRAATIQAIRFNPYTLTLELEGLSILEPDGGETFASLRALHLDIQWGSIFRWALVVNRLRIQSPYVRAVRRDDLSFSFSDLLASPLPGAEGADAPRETGAAPAAPRTGPPRFILRDLHVADGRLEFLDRPNHREHRIEALDLRLPFLSSLEPYRQEPARIEVALRYNEARLALAVETRPFSPALDTQVDARILDLRIPPLMAYSPIPLNPRIEAGSLGLHARVSFSREPGGDARIRLAGDAALRDLDVRDSSGGPLIRLPSLEISVADLDPAARRAHLSRIALQSPDLHVEREHSGRMNLQGLLPPAPPSRDPGAEQGSGAPLVLAVDEIRLIRGRASFSDLAAGGPFETTLSDLEVTVKRFTTEPGGKASVSVTARSEAGEAVELAGEFSLGPLWSEGTLGMKAFALRKYAPYYGDHVSFDVEDGHLDLTAQYEYSGAGPALDARAVVRSLSLTGLRMRHRGEAEPFLAVAGLTVRDAELNPAKRELHVAEVWTTQGTLAATRLPGGEISLQRLLPWRADAPSAAAQPPEATRDAPTGGAPWLVSVARLALDGYDLKLVDQTRQDSPTLTARQMKMTVENISTARDAKARLDLLATLNETGSIWARGELAVDPPAADLQVEIDGLELGPLAPYVPDNVGIALAGGNVSAQGHLTVRPDPQGGVALRFQGEVSSADFASKDKGTGEDFLKWKGLRVGGVDFTLSPMRVDIQEVGLTGLYSRIIIHPDGSLNVQNLAGAEGAAPPGAGAGPGPAREDAPPPPVRIGKVLIKNGQINFTDRSIKPHVTANMLSVEGVISELTSEETRLSDVNLTGKLEHQSPLEITGKINPLRRELFVDLKVRFKDIDLVRVNPYSQKYVGYKIQKGKLFLDLDYLIVRRKLESQNRVLFDQLTLGERVESPDALDLPIKLGISILKDRQGKIALELPVTGDIDDPQFDFGKIIWEALGNLFTKILTAPFALLGDLFAGGGGDEVLVAFEAGEAAWGETQQEPMARLATALHERPGLEIELQGRADPEEDGLALRRAAVLELLKREKLAELERNKQPLPPIQEIQIQPQERARYLRMAYDTARNPDAKKEAPGILTRVGSLLPFLAKDEAAGYPPPPEMEEFLMGHVRAQDEELRALALRRAGAVKDALIVAHAVEPERIFLLEPHVSAGGEQQRRRTVRITLR